jgi:hypothetical protein
VIPFCSLPFCELCRTKDFNRLLLDACASAQLIVIGALCLAQDLDLVRGILGMDVGVDPLWGELSMPFWQVDGGT